MQTFLKHLCGSVLVLISAGAGAGPAETHLEARKQWHQSIQAGYQALEQRADAYAEAAGDYCSVPNDGARREAEQAWQQAFLAWQQVRFVDFGPVEHNNLAWQFQFWPDPKNLIARKASYILKSDDLISRDLIGLSGVAVQGFPMAEYLLFDEDLNNGDNALPATRTCSLLTAVAHHIAANSSQLNRDWAGFRDHYIGTDQYRDTTVRAGMTALEILEERRLAQPMGLRGTGKRSAYAADAWRSGTSLKTMEATVRGLEEHYLPGLAVLLKEAGEQQLADRIDAQFDEVLQNFPQLHAPIIELLSEDERFRELQAFYMDIAQLNTLINDRAAVALGVVRGFNSSDGD